MAQIDYFLKFTNRAEALADLVAGAESVGLDGQGAKQFLRSHAVEVDVWRASQDTVDNTDPLNPRTVHAYLAGFFVLISLPRVVPALRDHAAVQLVINRDKMNLGQTGFILKSNVAAPILQDIRISPVFAGTKPKWGTLS